MRKRKVLSREEIKEKIRDKRSAEERGYQRDNALLEFKWGVSRGRNSYGYNICSLYVNGYKKASCNGGGYDMQGTCLGDWIAGEFRNELSDVDGLFYHKLLTREKQGFYGLTYHDPCFNPGEEEIEGKTISEREQEGKSLGLERYQAFYAASSPIPTDRCFIPSIDGACGMNEMKKILNALGYELEYITGGRNSKNDIYKLRQREEI